MNKNSYVTAALFVVFVLLTVFYISIGDSKDSTTNKVGSTSTLPQANLDNDKTYNMIRIFNGGISTFTQYYGNIKFKCTNIDYHKKTGRIKYMLFEQTTK